MKLKKNFHPRLFGFAGFSGSGKTTLIEKIITELKDLHIGYIKHDAHRFSIDHPGKDTFRQYEAGARMVYINDQDHFALHAKCEGYTLEKEFFKDCDLVLVEGHKYADHPKFLFLDEAGEARREFSEGKIKNVLATISLGEEVEKWDGIPAFHRDQVGCIRDFIRHRVSESVKEVELCGLVLAGGLSSRMGQDKSLLNYRGAPQALQVARELSELGLRTFLSSRKEQVREELRELPMIADRFLDFGPLGGILSAMTEFPGCAFLVMACDLPLVTLGHMRELLLERDPLKQATAYFNEDRKMFEPLFAIYEPKIYSRLLHFLGERVTCPQKVLFNSSIKKLPLPRQDFLFNANTPDEGTWALKQLEVSANES